MAAELLLASAPDGREARPDAAAWYALHTRPNFEFQVATALECRFETVLPFYLRRHRLHGRDTMRRRPLFPGYVFTFADMARDRALVLSVRGVVGVIGGRRPEPLPAAVIEGLKIAARDPEALGALAPKAGEPLTVAYGPLAGLAGIMERTKHQAHDGRRRLVIRIEFFSRPCQLELGEGEVYRGAHAAA